MPQSYEHHAPLQFAPTIFVVDVSGSKEPSVIHSALTAAIVSALPALSVTFLAFSTEVIGFTNHVEDPLAMLMEVQVGGGTFIWKGLLAVRERLKVGERTRSPSA